jgi:hypothetical protein
LALPGVDFQIDAAGGRLAGRCSRRHPKRHPWR